MASTDVDTATNTSTEPKVPVEAAATTSTPEAAPSTEADVSMTAPAESGSELQRKAAKQIEFYFADSNLPYDKFMWTLHTANEEHWVPIATVASFKRMKPYQSHGVPWVATALREHSTELEVDEKGENCRRSTEVKDSKPEEQMDRSIYAKGFGEEYPTLQQELESFFSTFGEIRALRMRRSETKEFKGSVFVEFDSKDLATSFLAQDPKPKWKDADLLIMSKLDYCEMKIKEKGLTGKAADARRSLEYSGPKKGFNAFREMEQAKKKGAKGGPAKPEPEVWLEFMGKKVRVYHEDGGSVKEEEYETVKNATLKFDGCGGDCKWNEIKDPLRDRFIRAPYIKFQKGDDSGLVGFDRALEDEDIAFIKEKIPSLGGNTITWSVADDSTNREYQLERLLNAAQRVISMSNRKSGRGGRGGGRGARGGRGGGRGGGRSNGNGHSNKGDSDSRGPATAPSSVPGEQDASAGEKRKRGVEPDGGAVEGVRGAGIPAIQSSGGAAPAVKKTKTDE
ncbi:hypothetical protein SISNIDRAFT_479724 [Sistotremastrum niveocremeum HHB9708]|uniref:HTH La-type RNA-binding domain-containing protein n=1 Tax=Sistotremastrum niveocremeum HHB9708 TaxID=1314777 RepID=A0A164QA37_9AGAM|nr:hypothetical protein SISNIDRAFT_479724 [Sistotremastrum niveocremeum HHB9708]